MKKQPMVNMKVSPLAPRPGDKMKKTEDDFILSADMSVFLVLAKIREAIGCGHKPMLTDLPEIVEALVAASKQLLAEHQGMREFSSGFNEATPCTCSACINVRAIPGVSK